MTFQAWKMVFLNSMTFHDQGAPWFVNTVIQLITRCRPACSLHISMPFINLVLRPLLYDLHTSLTSSCLSDCSWSRSNSSSSSANSIVCCWRWRGAPLSTHTVPLCFPVLNPKTRVTRTPVSPEDPGLILSETPVHCSLYGMSRASSHASMLRPAIWAGPMHKSQGGAI